MEGSSSEGSGKVEGAGGGGAVSLVISHSLGRWSRDTGFGRPARDLGDSVEAGGAPGFDLGFAAFAAEAGLLRGWGFVAPCGGGKALGRVHWDGRGLGGC